MNPIGDNQPRFGMGVRVAKPHELPKPGEVGFRNELVPSDDRFFIADGKDALALMRVRPKSRLEQLKKIFARKARS
jgi:hypothetical protein